MASELGPLRTRARIGAHVVWDALTRPIARAPGENFYNITFTKTFPETPR